ncbi:MAG: hypothetical protein MJA83_16900 [Gammaproteobacteria bacterium]|nr:hypothetical protein [Gammaproteobacteria bacterium]
MTHLDRHRLLKSGDLDAFRAIMERELGRHDLTFHGSWRGFEARVCAAPLAELALFHVSFGEFSFKFASRDRAEETFVFGLVTSGSGTIDQGREALNMAAGRAYMRDMPTGIATVAAPVERRVVAAMVVVATALGEVVGRHRLFLKSGSRRQNRMLPAFLLRDSGR